MPPPAESHKRIYFGLFCHYFVPPLPPVWLLRCSHFSTFEFFCPFHLQSDLWSPLPIFHCHRKRDCCYLWKKHFCSLAWFLVCTSWYFQIVSCLLSASLFIVLISFLRCIKNSERCPIPGVEAGFYFDIWLSSPVINILPSQWVRKRSWTFAFFYTVVISDTFWLWNNL